MHDRVTELVEECNALIYGCPFGRDISEREALQGIFYALTAISMMMLLSDFEDRIAKSKTSENINVN